MTTLTIHADDAFASAMKDYAANLGKSINQTVKDVFTPILGLAVRNEDIPSPWEKFYGSVPDIDSDFWERHSSEHRAIDEDLWK